MQSLFNGTYHHCEELQKLFKKLSNDKDFKLFIGIYITNDKIDSNVLEYIKEYNKNHYNIIMSLFDLKSIEDKYYNHSIGNLKKFDYIIKTINGGTVLNYNTKDYGIENDIEAKYILSPVSCIYRMIKNAKIKGYELFDSNIREYLGTTTGVNKRIYDTLNDKEERKNFFYYNNGITIICDKTTKTDSSTEGLSFKIENPQIVNGCQTVNSIYKVLDNFSDDNVENEFKNSFVMVKVLEIDKSSPILNSLYKNIVKYNNSQNSIKEDAFVKKNEIFNRMKIEFENKGFLLLVKASDKNTYKDKYNSKLTDLNKKNKEILEQFGFDTPKTLKDLYIDIDKLMQVVLAFKNGGHSAYTKKSDLFKPESDSYKTVMEFIKSNDVTMQTLLDLYLLFKIAETGKKKGERHPILYYLIDFFGKYECQKKLNLISKKLDSSINVDKIIKLYTAVTRAYMKEMNLDYNVLIKKPIDYDIIDKNRYALQDALN